MTSFIDINKPRGAQTRVELTLVRITSFWNVSQNGPRFSRELFDFLKAIDNKNTLQSYCFSILEFFDWYQRTFDTIVTPDKIRRSDAVEYSKWLRSRELGLEQWRVQQDPERGLDAKILDIVKKSPGCDIRHVRQELAKLPGMTTLRQIQDPDGNFTTMRVLELDAESEKTGGLAKRLACLVSVKNLFRTPSINQIRAKLTDVQLGPIDVTRVGIDFKVDPGIFKYYLPRQEAGEIERSGTVVSRLSALSSLWEYFKNSGENSGSSEQLIKHNIWQSPLEPVLEQAKSQAQVYRAQKTPTVDVIDRLIATTFQDTYREKAFQAAQAKLRGYQVKVPIRRTTFSDMRDRALLMLMVTMGLRAVEVTRVKNSSVSNPSGKQPMLEIMGKGNKKRLIPIPAVTYQAIYELQEKIQLMAENRVKYGSGSSFHVARLSKEAPLIPAVIYWGKNAGADIYKGLSRQAISAILKRRSLKAGLPPGTIEYDQAHPHGLRHLFANIARDSGTTMPDIQAMLGHSSMSTTGRYVEQHSPEALMAEAFKPRTPIPTGASITFQAPLSPMAPMVAGALPAVPVAMALPITPPERKERPAKPKSVKPVEIKRTPEEILERPVTSKPEIAPKKRTRKEISAVGFVDAIYENNWGEAKNRQRLGAGQGTKQTVQEKKEELPRELTFEEKRARGGIKELLQYVEAEEAIERQEEREDVAIVAEVSPKKLNQVYIGKSSGLLWWAGPGGKLKPEMPVISPAQAMSCGEDVVNGPVCQGLTGLWQDWMSEEGRGPTAASALVSWVVKALEITALVGREALGRRALFVPKDAPEEETEATHGEKGEDRNRFREHDPEKIVAWFSQVAWQYRESTGGGKETTEGEWHRESDVLDTLVVPDYYGSTDPIRDLPTNERNELLDWIASFTGQPIRDTRPRFQGASRVEIANLLGMMRQFESYSDEKFEAFRGGDKEKVADLASLMVTLDDNIKQRVDEYTRGRVRDFSIKTLRREKVQKRKLLTDEREASRSREKVHLKVVLDLFGEEAANDSAIRHLAEGPISGNVPCKGGSKDAINFLSFFRIKNDTIMHDEDVAKRFARITHAHSECVARRIARDLWELKKDDKRGKRILERKDQIALLICTLAEYKVPCPQAQEYELRSFLGSSRDPVPVYEAWKRAIRTKQDRERLSEEARMAKAYGEEFEPNTRSQSYRVNGSTVRALPSPVALIMLVVYA
ncbi:MAG: tyrosine-type recombinase/integrase [Syntrophorhabdaceae bacterium]|nr:tyrosine-type recombinase/integrase [Syntrophorhabdaceae bacterium]